MKNLTRFWSGKRRQTGVAALFGSVTLVLLASLATIYGSRSVQFEQMDSNNQYWATQAHEVAQSGVEHAIAWFKSKTSATDLNNFWVASSTANACPNGISGVQWQCFNMSSQTGVAVTDYTVDVRLGRDVVDAPNVATIQSTATNTSNNARATVVQKVYLPVVGNTPGSTQAGTNAPLVTNGCTSGITGNPDICPRSATGSPCPTTASCLCNRGTCSGNCSCSGSCSAGTCSGNGTCSTGIGTCGVCNCTVGTAIHSLYVPDYNSDGIIAQTEINQCLDLGHLDIHSGSRTSVSATATPSPTASGSCNNAAWNEIFGTTTKAQMQALSAAQAAAGLTDSTTPRRTVYWIDSTSNWHDSLGSATEPVILIFSSTACASDCPKINGSPTIYGTVFLDTQCDGTRANGWGGAEIYGTVAIESDMSDLNANTEIYFNGNTGSAFPPSLPPAYDSNQVQRVSGSWKDF